MAISQPAEPVAMRRRSAWMLYPDKEGDYMDEIVNMIINNGIGIVCVAYLIYFQNTTMTEMLRTLNSINTRLSIIEDKLERHDWDFHMK